MVRRDDNIHEQALRLIAEALEQAEWTPTLPTVGAMAARGYQSRSKFYRVLRALEKDLSIEREPKSRGDTIRLPGMPKVRVAPMLGRVAAGQPIPYYGEDVGEYVPLPANRVRGEKAFVVKVVGDSMTGDAILDGDFVVAVPDRSDPGEDEIVVVSVGDDSTVKRVQRVPDGIRLLSSNPERHPPIFVHYSEEPAICGRVVGVIRWLP